VADLDRDVLLLQRHQVAHLRAMAGMGAAVMRVAPPGKVAGSAPKA
jgi:hypothetical protein